MDTKLETFYNIWHKESNKMKDKIKSWMIVRGIEVTEENCRDYWMGRYIPMRGRNGMVEYLHKSRDRKQKWTAKNYRKTSHGQRRRPHNVEKKYRNKKRRTYGSRRRK